MAKAIKTIIKLQAPAGKANPGQQIGTALGPHGLNIMEFCTQFNERTRQLGDVVIPVELTVYEDRTYSFITKQPPAAELIKKAAGIEKGAALVGKEKVGRVTREQLRDIATQKLPDMSARSVEAAVVTLTGTARSMGVTVEN
jgi:large subunit ribosomal protein L11